MVREKSTQAAGCRLERISLLLWIRLYVNMSRSSDVEQVEKYREGVTMLREKQKESRMSYKMMGC